MLKFSSRREDQMKKRRSFTGRQRIEIVLEGLQSDASVSDVCRKHGISATLYYRWRDQLYSHADRLFGKGNGRADQELLEIKAEARHLKEVEFELTAENLDLKKTPGG